MIEKNKQPNILTFETDSGNKYIYDACSNLVYPSPDPIIDIIMLYTKLKKLDIVNKLSKKFSKNIILNCYEIVEKWIKINKAFFNYDRNLPKLSYTKSQYLKEISNRVVAQLTLCVTEDCNLRCKYCVYSGEYKYERMHNKNYMNFNIAKKAIDYFFAKHCKYEKSNFLYKEKSIGFYGGEPLLNLNLIKKCVEYINSKYNDNLINYNITTNGTMLSDYINEFFYKNDFNVRISLDGPEFEHDRNRITKDGNATYEKIIKNLVRFKKIYPTYFKNRVFILACYDWGSDLYKTYEYFAKDNNKLVKLARISQINSGFTDYYKKYKKKDYEIFSNNMDKLFRKYIDISINGRKNNSSYNMLSLLFAIKNEVFLRRDTFYKELSKYISPYTGSCTPGNKLYVSPDGKIHLCEKMNPHFYIGDVDIGIDFKMIKKIMYDYYYNVIKKHKCNICIGRNLCEVCFASCQKDGTFESDAICNNIKEYIIHFYKRIYSNIEKNPKLIEKILTSEKTMG